MAPRIILTVSCLLIASLPARAQEQNDLASALAGLLGRAQPTVLELSESARRDVVQDELAATLYARSAAAQVAAAQSELNRMMAAALSKAHAGQGIRVSSGAYQVYREQPSEDVWVWVASQDLDLSAADSVALLALVGELQAMGLAVRDLNWRVAEATRRAIEQALLTDAVRALEATAGKAADDLGLSMSGWRRVTLLPSEPQGSRFLEASSAMGAEVGVPPVAATGRTEIIMTVSGEALLEAKGR